ncbi:phage tail sheath family protein [Alteromonas halophila]|uniref:Phage tail sheath family protein n=1 Tax=Alteromonas halophila TaxID=516698 RepID=A0A918JP78_9ALTE|nr:phage tail sheath C-terminal domain-containing protein [Alteromonas halophila]GGW93373.1 hypothetical protein GCM10007391_29650 [Alteromonas halophila]
MPTYKAPGVYIKENAALPTSVAAVETAIPAFIGYTEKAVKGGQSVTGLPVRLTSLTEFEHIFGGPPVLQFGLTQSATSQNTGFAHAGNHFGLIRPSPYFRLYRSMQLYFSNGGGACYVISAGTYSEKEIARASLQNALDRLLTEPLPAMLVIPEAVSLKEPDCLTLQQSMLEHCAIQTQRRIAILDIFNGFEPITHSVAAFRNQINTATTGGFGAAYYPWLNTVLLRSDRLTYTIFDAPARALLQRIIAHELGRLDRQTRALLDALTEDSTSYHTKQKRPPRQHRRSPDTVDKAFRSLSQVYVSAINACAQEVNLLPPSAALAGIYAKTDMTRGVWKAPANVSINGVVAPAETVSEGEQQILNDDPDGKSVNTIRAFAGKGTLVWGARTLWGNDLQWRYISVRRTCIMLEQSIQKALNASVFEPNDEQVWMAVEHMIGQFLSGLWRQGALAGNTPDEAFYVSCGLGKSMTQADLNADRLVVQLGVAVTKPAEFIVLTIRRDMHQP